MPSLPNLLATSFIREMSTGTGMVKSHVKTFEHVFLTIGILGLSRSSKSASTDYKREK